MEDNGDEVVVLSYNRNSGKCNRFGTENRLVFTRKRTDFETNFLAFVGGKQF